MRFLTLYRSQAVLRSCQRCCFLLSFICHTHSGTVQPRKLGGKEGDEWQHHATGEVSLQNGGGGGRGSPIRVHAGLQFVVSPLLHSLRRAVGPEDPTSTQQSHPTSVPAGSWQALGAGTLAWPSVVHTLCLSEPWVESRESTCLVR